MQADLHVVMGPHYAKSYWLNHPRTILMDRCYYKGDPDHVSVGWLRPDGGRDFKKGTGRKKPKIGKATGDKTIFLADFGCTAEDADLVRFHPANVKSKTTLEQDLKRCNKAIGYKTTALVTAALMGLEIECKDPTNIMAQPDWLQLLPYADWHFSEIENGELWAHLR